MRPRCQPLRFICIPNERIMPEHTCFAFPMCLVPLGRRVCKLHQVGTNYTLPAPIFNVVEVAAFASEIILVTTRRDTLVDGILDGVCLYNVALGTDRVFQVAQEGIN